MREVVALDHENKNGMYTYATNKIIQCIQRIQRAHRSHLYTTRIVDYVLVLRARASLLSR